MSGVAMVNVMGLVTVYMTYGGDMTVADVKSWLNKVEELGIPDETRLENGMLKLTYKAPIISRTECSECPAEDKHVVWTMSQDTCLDSKKKED